MSTWTLGLSAFYHDSAAALLQEGTIVAAAQEERFTRKKHDSCFPKHAIESCLRQAGVYPKDITNIVFYDKPLLKFERLIETYLEFAPRGVQSFATSMPVWIKEKLFLKTLLNQNLREIDDTIDWRTRILFSEHHLSHAASAFFPSPFSEALILTMDGVGEWSTTTAAIGRNNQIEIIKDINFPHSLGLLYSAFTHFIGFKVNSGEYKVMGLAPYGTPRFTDLILDELVDVKEDGSFRLNLDYFNYCIGLNMTSQRFAQLFGVQRRLPEGDLTQVHMDIAASIQQVTEFIVLRLTKALQRETGLKNLCLAGGVALNCVANGKILKSQNFERMWIQPAAGDAGGALGAAFVGAHIFSGCPRLENINIDSMNGSYLGPSTNDKSIEGELNRLGAKFTVHNQESLIDECVQTLTEGRSLGWYQGRMEYGPRALGARSILADPRSPKMQSMLNLKIKFRESFRPFAPSILGEDVQDWFDLDSVSPYMLLTADVLEKWRLPITDEQQRLFGIDKLNVPRSKIPAVTHVDYSARIQTVHPETNPLYYDLLKAFKQKTGCPILVNTSFNIRGEPIVCSVEDAYRCFMGTDLDTLAIGSFLLHKKDQPAPCRKDYRAEFTLD